MIFRMGRKDAEKDADVSPTGRLIEADEPRSNIYSKVARMGFNKQEFVALMGQHTIGFAEEDKTGFQGRWTMNPYVFDNTYYQEVLLGERSKYLKTEKELLLLEDEEMRRYVQMYADDQNLFFEHYANAHVKLSELGQEEHLLSEFSETDNKEGGYVENRDLLIE